MVFFVAFRDILVATQARRRHSIYRITLSPDGWLPLSYKLYKLFAIVSAMSSPPTAYFYLHNFDTSSALVAFVSYL